jgi:hypothetical protein
VGIYLFICGLFNVVSSSDYVVSSDGVIMNWKKYKRDWLCCPGIYLDRLKKIMKNISQDNWSAVRDLNPGPPRH